MTRPRQILGFAGWLLAAFAAGAAGAIASLNAQAFYMRQVQPPWAPPPGVFGPVWTVLYTMMAIAAWLVWRRGGWSAQRLPLTVFVGQLLLNALWSWLFFAWHRGGPALLDIVFLWLSVAVTLRLFWRVRTPAGALLIPYLAWVSFAAVLNYSVWQLNPLTLG